MVIVGTWIGDECHDVSHSVSAAINGDLTILSAISCLHGVGTVSNVNHTIGSDDLSAYSFFVQAQCSIALANSRVVVVTIDSRIINYNLCACRSHIHGAKTVQSGIFDGYNCVGSRSCHIHSVVSCGCGYVFDCKSCGLGDYVNRTLALCIDCKVLDSNCTIGRNVDRTTCCRFEGLAVTVKCDCLVDYKDIRESNVTEKCYCLAVLCRIDCSLESFIVGVTNLSNNHSSIINVVAFGNRSVTNVECNCVSTVKGITGCGNGGIFILYYIDTCTVE